MMPHLLFHRPKGAAWIAAMAAAACVSWGGTAQAQTQTPAAAAAQRGAGRGAGRADLAGPGEVQRLFDAYIVIRAQEFLGLDDDQFTAFLPRLRAVQETRRRNDVAHNQLVAELARLTAPKAAFDEAQVRDKLKALQELNARAAAELRRAYDAIDLVLDLRRQARFRVFELQMERRKLDLVLQARRADAARQQEPAAPIKKFSPAPAAAKKFRLP